MKKSVQTIALLFVVLGAVSIGCKMPGGNQISNEQISNDLLDTNILVKSGEVMEKDEIVTQCFKVNASRFEGDSGELTIDLFRGDKSNRLFGVGEVTAAYKKSGDSWKIQNVTATTYNVTTPVDDKKGQEIIRKGAPLCGSYESKLWGK